MMWRMNESIFLEGVSSLGGKPCGGLAVKSTEGFTYSRWWAEPNERRK
jgi:hypothetical protein